MGNKGGKGYKGGGKGKGGVKGKGYKGYHKGQGYKGCGVKGKGYKGAGKTSKPATLLDPATTTLTWDKDLRAFCIESPHNGMAHSYTCSIIYAKKDTNTIMLATLQERIAKHFKPPQEKLREQILHEQLSGAPEGGDLVQLGWLSCHGSVATSLARLERKTRIHHIHLLQGNHFGSRPGAGSLSFSCPNKLVLPPNHPLLPLLLLASKPSEN